MVEGPGVVRVAEHGGVGAFEEALPCYIVLAHDHCKARGHCHGSSGQQQASRHRYALSRAEPPGALLDTVMSAF